jgi:hypothetical protein|tara:strand:- start:330 stop:908 length:579 start_codon:yes stop_codon:yes gene_type:complete
MVDEEETQSEDSGQDPIEELQLKAKKQLTILFAACASSVVFLGMLGFTYTTLTGKLLSATQEPLIEMKNLSGLVSEEYSNLTMAVEFYNHQMKSLGQRLDDIDPTIDQTQFAKLENVIISQEHDFQVFLSSAQDAVFGLSEMVSGSRGWRQNFKSKLDLAIAASEARALNLSDEVAAVSSIQEAIDGDVSAP